MLNISVRQPLFQGLHWSLLKSLLKITHRRIDQPTAVSDHFTFTGHSLNNIELIPLEFINSNGDADLQDSCTLSGMNRRDEIKTVYISIFFLAVFCSFSLFLSTNHVTYFLSIISNIVTVTLSIFLLLSCSYATFSPYIIMLSYCNRFFSYFSVAPGKG